MRITICAIPTLCMSAVAVADTCSWYSSLLSLSRLMKPLTVTKPLTAFKLNAAEFGDSNKAYLTGPSVRGSVALTVNIETPEREFSTTDPLYSGCENMGRVESKLMTSIVVGTEELSGGIPLSDAMAVKLYVSGVRVPATLTVPVSGLTVNWVLDGSSMKVKSALEPMSLSLADNWSTLDPMEAVSTN